MSNGRAKKTKQLAYHFWVYPGEEGFPHFASCRELFDCTTEGDTMEEVEQNARECVKYYLEQNENAPLPQPLMKRKNVIAIIQEPK